MATVSLLLCSVGHSESEGPVQAPGVGNRLRPLTEAAGESYCQGHGHG